MRIVTKRDFLEFLKDIIGNADEVDYVMKLNSSERYCILLETNENILSHVSAMLNNVTLNICDNVQLFDSKGQ